MHPTLADFSAFQSQIALDKAISDGLHNLRASEVGGLQTRVAALEAALATLQANALSFKWEGGQVVPLYQLQLKTGDFPGSAYYPQSGILKVQLSPPADQNPY